MADEEINEVKNEEERVHPKQARKRSRSLHSGESRPARTVEERVAERSELRKQKAAARRAYRAKLKVKQAAKPKAPLVAALVPEKEASRPKVRQGLVVSDKADKTITVRIDMARRHPRYEKIIRSSSTLHAHDEKNDANVGDMVRVLESRPLSRSKRWRLVEILGRAK